MDGQTLLGVSVIIATVVGPVVAVAITLKVEKNRQTHWRQVDVSRMLMRTRRAVLSVDNVTALNLVEIEFHGVKPVTDAFGELYRHLALPPPFPPDWGERRMRLQTRLLSQIAKHLGYTI